MSRAKNRGRLFGRGLATATLVAAALTLAGFAAPAAAAPKGELPSPRSVGPSAYVPGEAIVRFEPGVGRAARQEARRAAGVTFEDPLLVPRAELVEVEGSVKGAIGRLESRPGVAYAQPNYRYEALAVEAPDDTFFSQLWGLSDPALPQPGVGALAAWQTTKGSGQVIAVVDTGVDLTHPDVAPNLWENPLPDPVDQDLHGYDFVDDDGDPDEFQFHGTHVAGTAAAVAGNATGIAGVAPEAQIMAVRVLDGDGSGTSADIGAGIAYAALHGADVINLSLGGSGATDKAMSDAVDVAAANDAVVVAAAGNEASDNETSPSVPCVLPQPNLICVAAISESGALAGFSNWGAQAVDLAAPGTQILSAKVDYGPPVLSDGFEAGSPVAWGTFASNGGVAWGLTTATAAGGSRSATDSPAGDYGTATDPSEFASSELFTSAPVNLTGERGCRLHFRTKYQIEPPAPNGSLYDAFAAGAVGGSEFDGNFFADESSGYPTSFDREEVSISSLDGRNDVFPVFGVLSDYEVEYDGAYVDDVRLLCRDETYTDAISPAAEYDQPNAGSYVRFQGTSMAAPHVAGVAALVRAAVPGASAVETVDAIRDGAAPMPAPDPGRPTRTQGIADACRAIAYAQPGTTVIGCGTVTTDELPPGTVAGAEATIEQAAPPAAIPPRALAAPQTFFGKRPPKVIRTRDRRGKAVFRFASDQPGATFLCKVDRSAWRRCPQRLVRRLKPGKHVVKVKADAEGRVDSTPAVFRFRVKRIR